MDVQKSDNVSFIKIWPSFKFAQLLADKWWQGWQAPRRWRCRWWWGGRRWWRCWRRTSARSPPVCSQRSQAGCATQSWWGLEAGRDWLESGDHIELKSCSLRACLLSFSPFSPSRCFATDHCQHVVTGLQVAQRACHIICSALLQLMLICSKLTCTKLTCTRLGCTRLGCSKLPWSCKFAKRAWPN